MQQEQSGVGETTSFDKVVVTHLDVAYRLARWLTGDNQEAEDVVQEAAVRALRYFRTFSGGDARAWFLRIVRNTCYDVLNRRRNRQRVEVLTDDHVDLEGDVTPESAVLRSADIALVERVLSDLPARARELLVLREIEGLSYQELAAVLDLPIGTVMSGLSRARRAFSRSMRAKLAPSLAG
jgi:RNA polymerase sigma-70 factor (ECF subfamily)